MPTTESNGFLNDSLETNEDRFGTVIAGNNHFGVAREDGKLLLAAISAALV